MNHNKMFLKLFSILVLLSILIIIIPKVSSKMTKADTSTYNAMDPNIDEVKIIKMSPKQSSRYYDDLSMCLMYSPRNRTVFNISI